MPALAIGGFGAPAPALLALTWIICAGIWWKHYAIRPAEPQEEPAEDPTADEARWERLAARNRWSGHLGKREDIHGGRKYEILLDGAETHIGDVLGKPRAIAAAWDRAMTEAYAEPHGTGVESRGTLTLLSRGTLEQVREWDGSGISDARPRGYRPVRRRGARPRLRSGCRATAPATDLSPAHPVRASRCCSTSSCGWLSPAPCPWSR